MNTNILSLADSLVTAWLQVSPIVANVVLVLVLLLIGVLIARGLGQLTAVVLKTLMLDQGATQLGFNKLLQKGELKVSASELIGDLVYWVLTLVVIVGVLGNFGLPVEAALLNVVAYTGIVFLAVFILGVGLLLAGFISSLVKIIMLNLGLASGKTVARIIYLIVVIFAFLAALAQLGISQEVFIPQIGVIIGAFGLAAAIAFGLGCKDMAADFLHNLFKGK